MRLPRLQLGMSYRWYGRFGLNGSPHATQRLMIRGDLTPENGDAPAVVPPLRFQPLGYVVFAATARESCAGLDLPLIIRDRLGYTAIGVRVSPHDR
jgi:hypothetical protein